MQADLYQSEGSVMTMTALMGASSVASPRSRTGQGSLSAWRSSASTQAVAVLNQHCQYNSLQRTDSPRHTAKLNAVSVVYYLSHMNFTPHNTDQFMESVIVDMNWYYRY